MVLRTSPWRSPSAPPPTRPPPSACPRHRRPHTAVPNYGENSPRPPLQVHHRCQAAPPGSTTPRLTLASGLAQPPVRFPHHPAPSRVSAVYGPRPLLVLQRRHVEDSSIKASVHTAVEAAFQKSMLAFIEESAEETARCRTRSIGEAGRRRIELQEERVRHDPVLAEKMARRDRKSVV